MKLSTKIITYTAVAVVLIGVGIGVAASVPASHTKPITASRSATAALPSGKTVTPSVAPTSTPVADSGSQDGEEMTGNMPIILNIADFERTAQAGTLAYMTLSPDETVAVRAARLAPYFPAGSTFLTQPPLMQNPQGYAGVRTTVVATSKAQASTYPTSTTATSYTFDVYLSYDAQYATPGNIKDIPVVAGMWTVTMNKTFDGKIQSIQEPNLN